jgi:hypothetical protein
MVVPPAEQAAAPSNYLPPITSMPEHEQQSPVENEQADEDVAVENDQTPQEPEVPLTGPQKSWRELRLKAERAEQMQRERDEAIKYAQAIEQEAYKWQQQQRAPQQQEEPEYDYNSLNEEDLVDGRTIKKILASESKKRAALESNIRQSQQQSYEAAISAQLKSTYSDFDRVLTPENIAHLREMRPGLARSLAANPDLAEKARETYNIIKDLGIYRSVEEQTYAPVKKQMQNNVNKPRSSNSVSPQAGDTPLNQANMFANGLTPDVKAALWADMQKKRSSYT